MVIFSPLLVPQDIPSRHTDISFLGSILERVNIANEKPFIVDNISFLKKIDRIKDVSSMEVSLGQPSIVSDPSDIQPAKEKFLMLLEEDNKPPVKISRIIKEVPEIKFSNFLLKGDAVNRQVLYKPDLSKVFILPSDFNFDYKVDVRFRISRHGFVQSPECIVSSGYSEVDQMVVRYIRGWQFAPSDKDTKEGIVHVGFD